MNMLFYEVVETDTGKEWGWTEAQAQRRYGEKEWEEIKEGRNPTIKATLFGRTVLDSTQK